MARQGLVDPSGVVRECLLPDHADSVTAADSSGGGAGRASAGGDQDESAVQGSAGARVAPASGSDSETAARSDAVASDSGAGAAASAGVEREVDEDSDELPLANMADCGVTVEAERRSGADAVGGEGGAGEVEDGDIDGGFENVFAADASVGDIAGNNAAGGEVNDAGDEEEDGSDAAYSSFGEGEDG